MSDTSDESVYEHVKETWSSAVDGAADPAAAGDVSTEVMKATGIGFRSREAVDALILVVVTAAASASVNSMILVMLNHMYKRTMHLTVSELGVFAIFSAIPQYVQPFIGGWMDAIPALGYHRRSYYGLFAIIEALGFLSLAYMPVKAYLPVLLAVICYSSGAVVVWIATNAVMVSIGNQTGTYNRMQAFKEFAPVILNIVVLAWLSGYVAQHWSYKHAFTVAALISLVRIPCAFLIREKRVTQRVQGVEERLEQARILAERRARTAALLKKAVSTPGFWVVMLYIFYLIVTPGPNVAIYYYQHDALHLTDQQIGNIGVWTSAGSMIGIFLFGWLSRWMSVRSLVWGAMLMDLASYPCYMIARPHGHLTYLITAAAFGIYTITGIIYSLCLWGLGARLTPPGIEGAIYSGVLAVIALAGSFSNWIGARLYDIFGPANHSAHYTVVHGWYGTLWFGFFFTLAAVLFIPFLPAWCHSKEPIRPRNREQEPAARAAAA